MLQARGGGLLVIEDNEVDDDLVRDMTEIMTCFCGAALRPAQRRQPGQESAQHRAGMVRMVKTRTQTAHHLS